MRGGGGAGRNSSLVAQSSRHPTQVSPSPSTVTGPKTEGEPRDAQESSAGSADAAGPEGSAFSFCGNYGSGCDWKLLEMAAAAAKTLNIGYSHGIFTGRVG